eukprot:3009880-Lingulodinium_polyedra.AAC.1
MACAAPQRVLERDSEHVSHESCSGMRSEMHSNAAAPRVVAKRPAPCEHHLSVFAWSCLLYTSDAADDM